MPGAFQADDEGSIPFTRSIFKIKDLSGILRELSCALNVLGVTSGVTNARFRAAPVRARLEASRSTEKAIGDSRPPPISPTSISGSQVRVLLRYLARRNERKLLWKFHLGAWEESLGDWWCTSFGTRGSQGGSNPATRTKKFPAKQGLLKTREKRCVRTGTVIGTET
jgi:hypothetical protein